jgi:hypothetical protein
MPQPRGEAKEMKECDNCGGLSLCCSFYIKFDNGESAFIPILKCRFYNLDARNCEVYDKRECPKGSKMLEAGCVPKSCSQYVGGPYRHVASNVGCLRAIRDFTPEQFEQILKNFKVDL